MLLKENLKIKLYLVLTIINILCANYIIGSSNVVPILTLFVGFVLNQLLLLYGVKKLTTPSLPSSSIKILIIFVLKFSVLVATMIYALHSIPGQGAYCLLFYIFQLIILVISIKRIPKKLRN